MARSKGKGDNSEKKHAPRDGAQAGRPGGGWSALRPWQRWTCVLSALVCVLGLGLMGVAWATSGSGDGAGRERSAPNAMAPSPLQPQGLVATEPGQQPGAEGVPEQGDQRALDRWSPTVFRLGFGFFMGFAVAFALRTFVKISLVAIGLMFLVLMLLQWQGVISVEWAKIEGHYDGISAWLGTQTKSFTAFVSGYLPSAAATIAGFVTGFRRT